MSEGACNPKATDTLNTANHLSQPANHTTVYFDFISQWLKNTNYLVALHNVRRKTSCFFGFFFFLQIQTCEDK